jgi:lysophospholipase L1-like esterase
MPWAEYYSDIRNRGIGGDTSVGLLDRIGEISDRRPKQLFINIGTNDLSFGFNPEAIAENISQIVTKVRSTSRSTEVFVISVLPINLDFLPDVRNETKLGVIRRLNQILKVSEETVGFRFIEIASQFEDERGQLRRELTLDGGHLNHVGEKLYCELLMQHVDSKELVAQRRCAITGARPHS